MKNILKVINNCRDDLSSALKEVEAMLEIVKDLSEGVQSSEPKMLNVLYLRTRTDFLSNVLLDKHRLASIIAQIEIAKAVSNCTIEVFYEKEDDDVEFKVPLPVFSFRSGQGHLLTNKRVFDEIFDCSLEEYFEVSSSIEII